MIHQPQSRSTPAGARVTVIQGQHAVSDDPSTVMTTVLGSCVAACIWDAGAGVGGMNHFLLPKPAGAESGDALRYGVHSMELLLNALFRAGARRTHLQARLFGGAKFSQSWDVGQRNAEFATQFLESEGIPHLGGSLGGHDARRVEFWPVSGRARQRAALHDSGLLARERPRDTSSTGHGEVHLF